MYLGFFLDLVVPAFAEKSEHGKSSPAPRPSTLDSSAQKSPLDMFQVLCTHFLLATVVCIPSH